MKLFERPRSRSEDNIKIDVKETELKEVDWIDGGGIS
jgi:hypothetical protein